MFSDDRMCSCIDVFMYSSFISFVYHLFLTYLRPAINQKHTYIHTHVDTDTYKREWGREFVDQKEREREDARERERERERDREVIFQK